MQKMYYTQKMPKYAKKARNTKYKKYNKSGNYAKK